MCVCVLKSEDMWESALAFPCVGPGDWAQIVKFGKCPDPLNRLASSYLFFETALCSLAMTDLEFYVTQSGFEVEAILLCVPP